ncbi:MAG TPA: DUF1622 domain-containing protein [Allosphingosinicella sp.]|nr:DUF1622 domain-containing protein [Allosphingosinicella sp.]
MVEPSEHPDALARFMEPVATGLEIFGVLVIVAGILWATGRFLLRDLRSGDGIRAYERYRANLGRGILLGLEILVGADIVATVTAPLTFRSVGLLGLIVLIRTFLSFSLETEIEGRWPWRRRGAPGETDSR